MQNKYIDVALRVSGILSTADHEIHMVVRSPKDGADVGEQGNLVVIPVTDTKEKIYGKYKTTPLSSMYDLFKTINTGVSSVEGSPEQLSMYFGTNGSGTAIGQHECGYIIEQEQLNDFKNHCKIKLSPNGYIYVIMVDDVSNQDSVVSAIEKIMEIA